MFLNEEQLFAAAHGWVDQETVDGYSTFYRFTKAQRDYYGSTEFASKEYASSGMFLEFETDASALRFEYSQTKASSQNFFFFDIFVNGKLVWHIGCDNYTNHTEGTVEQDLSEGEKTVRVVFPNLSATGIRNFELKDATVFRPTKRLLKYIAYGDSITQGYTAFSPALVYANLTAEGLNADLYNLGIGGEVFQPLMIDENYPVNADIVTVAYGTNDWGHVEPEKDAVNRKGFFEKLVRTHKGAKIFVLLPIWRGKELTGATTGYGTLEDYRSMLREEMKQYPEITVIEGIDLVPHHEDFYKPDVLHPNDLGFTQYAKNLLTELKRYL